MPQNLASTDGIGLAPLKKTLRFRIIALITALSTGLAVSVSVLTISTSQNLIIPVVLTAYLILTLAAVYLAWRLLKPLEILYQGSQILARGELNHRISIQSGDEIEFIAAYLNTLSRNLNQTLINSTQSQEYVIAEKNKLDTIISSIVDGVIVLDLHNQVILANTAAAKMTGYAIKEMAGKTVDDLVILKNQEGKLINLLDCCRLDSSGRPITQSKMAATLIGKGGQELKVNTTIAPIHEGIQANLGCIMILHDVTQDKVLQQMQIDFVSMASHEIRTPLTSISNYLSVIENEGAQQLSPELREFLNRALTSSRQLAVLVDNLLNVSKIERNSFSISLQPLDWKKNLTQVVNNSLAQAIQKNIRLELKIPDQLPTVQADEIRINEVLNNLINNALTYTKEGGRVEVGSKVSGNDLITYVADNGDGIPPEAVPHLFTKFFRVAGSLNKGSKGTGLGLYISKSVMDLHHGNIWVDSKVGRGSTFYFSLPLNNPATSMPTIVKLHS